MPDAGSPSLPVAIIGGGPAGSVAALCLRKLGREVEIFEKARFPRYKVGESLLPGTLSILKRLGVYERIEAAGFIKKRAATFLWGPDGEPWTFSFATPKTAPWVFDHGLQVNRDEYDQILLDAARDAGAVVHQECEVNSVDTGNDAGDAGVEFQGSSGADKKQCAYVIDASGTRGVVAQAHGLRRWDAYFRNIALWSYFRGGKRFDGELEGNILSVPFAEGWIWIIPLKDNAYSVGVVTGIESGADIQSLGKEAFYDRCLDQCAITKQALDGAEQTADVRVTKEWSYDARALSLGRTFLCGDAACFVDPLFSQGVHLATYSGMLAAAAIDYLLDHPDEADAVGGWYERSYRAAYGRYHKFLCAFYSENHQQNSRFWSSRKIAGAADERMQNVEWLQALTGVDPIKQLSEGADLLAGLWRHSASRLDDGLKEQEVALRRVRWAGGVLKTLKKAQEIRWAQTEVRVAESFAVGAESFRLERRCFLADSQGQAMMAHAVTPEQRELFKQLVAQPLPYNELAARLSKADGGAAPLQTIMHMMEDGLLEARDRSGDILALPQVLRFAGVGGDDDFS